MFWILLIGVAVGILFKPRIFTWLGLFFFELMFFSRESTSGALTAAIVLGAVACLRMEFTKDCSAIMYEVKGYDCKNPPTDGLILHAAIIGLLYAVPSYIVWVWSIAAQPGTRFLRLFIIYPAIALGMPLLSETLAPWIMRRRIIDTHNKEVEAERQRLIAEHAAVENRLKLAFDNMEKLWEKALNAYGGCEGGELNAFGIKGTPSAGLTDAIIYKRMKIEPPMVPMYFDVAASFQGDMPAPTKVWVTNEQRLQAIDNILQGLGMLDGNTIRPPQARGPETIQISDPGDSDNRPWLWFIEYLLNFYYKDMSRDCYDAFNQVIKFYEGERKAIQAGIDGEEYIRRTLDMHDGEFFVLYDLRLEFPGGDGGNDSVETDAFVLAPNGLFAIETKNYGSTGKYKISVTADGQWYKELQSGRRESIPNPVAQNDRHIAFLSKFINDLLGRDMMNRAAIENVIAIANDAVEINVYPGAPLTVTRAGNLYGCIMSDRTQKFTLDELQLLKRELEKRALPPKAFPLDDYSNGIKWTIRKRKVLYHGSHILNQAKREHPDWFAAI